MTPDGYLDRLCVMQQPLPFAGSPPSPRVARAAENVLSEQFERRLLPSPAVVPPKDARGPPWAVPCEPVF